MIVYWSGWDIVWKLMVSVLVWLGGLTLVSYLGDYPEPAAGNRGLLTVSTSIPVVLALSTVV